MGSTGSLQSTPESFPVLYASLPSPAPLNLSESLYFNAMTLPPTSSPSTNAMAAAMSKGTGLIRRASRGAQQVSGRLRRRGSAAHRDSSSGPVLMRRRSDSKGVTDAVNDVSDLELTFEDEDVIEDLGESHGEPLMPLGISSSRPSLNSINDAGAVAPVRDSRLEKGTILTKFTKRKRKDIMFRLNFDSAKVYWDPSRPSKHFYVDDVREIRTGEEARHYREECGYPQINEPLWFTIIYSNPSRSKGRTSKAIHLAAPDKPTFDLWTQTLDAVSRSRIEMMAGLAGSAEKVARTLWRRAMDKKFENVSHSEDDEVLDFAGVMKLCRSLHINCTEATLREYFAEFDSDRTNSLNQGQFLSFVKKLKERKDVKQIYEGLRKIYEGLSTTSNQEIDKVVFFAFLKDYQGVDVDRDLEHWSAVFDRYARASKSKATPPAGGEIPLPLTMSFPAFQAFLSSPPNSVYAPPSSEPRLDRPLNEYFISSSHNTYLLGRQVVGESSTEAYVDALQKGCRCIEIDCWDGSDGNPIVMHGRTLTKSISFSDTIKVIDKWAFSGSVYPLIISLEVHCSPEQQARMTDIMIRVFGEKLVLKPLDPESTVLPSPEQLKYKILIKVKAPRLEAEAKYATNDLPIHRRQRSISSPWSRPIDINDPLLPSSPMLTSHPSMTPPERSTSFWMSPRASTTSATPAFATPGLVSSADESDGPHVTLAEDKKRKKSKTSNIIPKLGELGVYTRGYKFSSFAGEDACTHNHVFSFAERTFDKLCKPDLETKQLLEEHNMRCLMRVYPSGHRINSSNFDPLKFWRRGVQMAALNWQTYDLGQQINEAMFAAGNDRTGYVLKPEDLRYNGYTPIVGPRKKVKQRVRFSVDIISAQQLPRPRGVGPDAKINPYVEFEMYSAEDKGRVATGEGGLDASARNGLSGIGQPLRKRTIIREGNGYDPNWNQTIAMDLTTRYPSLVFVRWTVWNSIDGRNVNNTPLASFTAKLSSLQQGYRHLPLFDVDGERYLFSTLFCKITKEDFEDVDEDCPSCAYSVEPSSPLEPTSAAPRRSLITKMFSRTGSEKKKSKEPDSVFFSRSSTMER